MINIKDSLELDDENEYVVVSKADYNNNTYYYILDKYNNSNYKICYQENDELIEVNNTDLERILIPLFFDKVKEEIINLMN